MLMVCLFGLTVGPGAAGAEEGIVVLSIRERGESDAARRHSPRWTRFLAEYLDSIGQRVADSSDLSVEERITLDVDSLEEHKEKLKGTLIIWGEVQDIPDHQHRAKLFLYDLQKHAQNAVGGVAMPGQIELVLGQLAQQLLAEHAQPPPPKVAEQPRPVATTLFQPIAQPKLPVWRKRLAVGLGIAGSCLLVSSVLMTFYQPSLFGISCSYPNSSVTACDFSEESHRTIYWGTGFALAGLLGIGAVVTVIAPWGS